MKHSLSIFLLVVAGLWNAVLSATSPTSSVYPLRPSANGRYMLDASNAPFLIIGDAPHSILANLNNRMLPPTSLIVGTTGLTRCGLSFCATVTQEAGAQKALPITDLM